MNKSIIFLGTIVLISSMFLVQSLSPSCEAMNCPEGYKITAGPVSGGSVIRKQTNCGEPYLCFKGEISNSENKQANSIATWLGLAGGVPNTISNDTNNPSISKTDTIKEESSWSEKTLCEFIRGCLSDGYCYSFGHTKNGQYCGIGHAPINSSEKREFINQSESGENCTYDFECKSNFCFKEKCVEEIDSLLLSFQNKIDNLNQNLNEEKTKTILLMNDLNQSKENLEEVKINDNIQTQQKPKGIIGFFRRIFG